MCILLYILALEIFTKEHLCPWCYDKVILFRIYLNLNTRQDKISVLRILRPKHIKNDNYEEENYDN